MTFTPALTDTRAQTHTGDSKLSFDANVDQSTQAVRLIYPTPENDYRITIAIVPPGSKFHAGAHWHEDYDEVMKVVKGRGKIRLGNEYRVYTPEDGEVLIKRGVLHDIMRADVDEEEGDDEELWIEERSEPVDGSKELFFRHAFSTTTDKDKFGWKFPLQMLLLLMYTDNYMHFVPGPASWYFTHGLYRAVKPVALWLGLKPFYPEYTPERLKGVAKAFEEGRKMKHE